MKQRFLSIFLVLALIIPFFPQVTLPAKAAETTAKTQDENSNDRDHKEGSIGSITDGTRTGKKEEGNKNGFTTCRCKGRRAEALCGCSWLLAWRKASGALYCR